MKHWRNPEACANVPTMRSVTISMRESIASVRLILGESMASFLRNGGFDRAAALAFYGFLSMVPLLLLEVVVVAQVIHSSERALDVLETLMATFLPESSQFVLNEVWRLSLRKSWGLLTLVALIWSATPLASGIRSAFQAIFRPEKPRSFIRGIVFDVIAVVAALAVLGAMVLLKVAYAASTPLLTPGAREIARLVHGVAFVVGLPLLLMLFYHLFIPAHLKPRHLVVGSVVTAILLSAISPLFTFILRYNPNYGVTFGSLKAIFLLFIWVYYSFAVILLGTEIMANMARHEALIISRLFSQTRIKSGARRLLNRFVQVFAGHEEIFHEGQPGEAMYYVLHGSVALSRDGQRFRDMKAGEYFGEMAMLLGTARTLSAVATEPDTELVVISRENLDMVLKENPKIILSILREMAARLKNTDDTIRPVHETTDPPLHQME